MNARNEHPLSLSYIVPLDSALLCHFIFYSTLRGGQCFLGCCPDVVVRLSRYAYESTDTCYNPTLVSCFFFCRLLCEKKVWNTCNETGLVTSTFYSTIVIVAQGTDSCIAQILVFS